MQVVLKIGRKRGAAPCALCRKRTEFTPGVIMTLEGSDAPVCPDCGERHAPELAEIVATVAEWQAMALPMV